MKESWYIIIDACDIAKGRRCICRENLNIGLLTLVKGVLQGSNIYYSLRINFTGIIEHKYNNCTYDNMIPLDHPNIPNDLCEWLNNLPEETLKLLE